MPPGPPINHPQDFSGVIPAEFSAQIIEEAVQQSAVLQLGNRLPMGTTISDLPIPKTLPKAAWTGAPGGRKAWTDVMLDVESVHAEEVAAVTAIPDAYLEDSTINLWAWVRPRLAEAIAIALDDAVLFGINAPATFPAGGLVNPLYTQNIPNGRDAVDAVNRGMGLVETEGLGVTGHAADLAVKSVLRGVRDDTGGLLLGTEQVGQMQRPTLYAAPIAYNSWSRISAEDLITGAWNNLIIGVRQDIRFSMNPSAVIADDDGKVIISGWQDNTTPMKVWARFGCAIIRPVTPRRPNGARPFARMRLVGMPSGGAVLANHPHGPVDGADEGGGSARKAPAGKS